MTMRYDVTQTPRQRMLAAPGVSEDVKARLRDAGMTLDPAVLRRQIERAHEARWRLAGARRMRGA
ncbi:MAG: hypothetical protein ACYDAR_02595 [Thermomicrobiales bacterium]